MTNTAQNILYHTILLVEDDRRLSAAIAEYLQQQGLSVETEYRGDTAVQRILDLQPDLVILDLMLPGLDGLEVCKQVRADYERPILILTAKDEDFDEVVGLEIGADDYVVKPVKPRILLARIRALLRRFSYSLKETAPTKEDILNFGKLTINSKSREVKLNQQSIKLTTKEYEMLYILASHAGQTLSRDQLFHLLFNLQYDGLDRSVDIKISHLRKLLEPNPSKPVGIKTIHGKGYLFVASAW